MRLNCDTAIRRGRQRRRTSRKWRGWRVATRFAPSARASLPTVVWRVLREEGPECFRVPTLAQEAHAVRDRGSVLDQQGRQGQWVGEAIDEGVGQRRVAEAVARFEVGTGGDEQGSDLG